MATTPNLGLPLYEGTDTAKLSTLLNGQSTALDTNIWALIGNLLEDTGWVDIPYLAGFSSTTCGQLAYRVRGGVLYLRGGAYDINATGLFEAGTYVTVSMTPLPVEYRPPFTIRGGAAPQLSATGRSAMWEVTSAGQINLSSASVGTTPRWIAMSAAIPL